MVLLLVLPLLTYSLYPPEIKRSEEVAKWADRELVKMRGMSVRELTVAVLVTMALVVWIFGGGDVNATTVALMVVVAMLLTRVFAWEDVLRYSAAWNTLA